MTFQTKTRFCFASRKEKLEKTSYNLPKIGKLYDKQNKTEPSIL